MPLDNYCFIRLDPDLVPHDPGLQQRCREIHNYFGTLEPILVQPKKLLGGKELELPRCAERKKTHDEKVAKARKQRSMWEWLVGLNVS
jgi:hypothetical protein